MTQQKKFENAIKKNNIKKVALLLKDINVMPDIYCNYPIGLAVSTGHVDIIKLLLKDKRVDPFEFYSEEDSYDALSTSCNYGNIEIVKLLLNDSRVNQYSIHRAIHWASIGGFLDIVKLLLKNPLVDPSFAYNKSLYEVSKNGYLDILKLLLQNKKNNYDKSLLNTAFVQGAKYGKIDVVEFLLKEPLIDPTYKNNLASRMAYRYYNINTLFLLFHDERVNKLLKLKQPKIHSDVANKYIQSKLNEF
jgi:ankyrin repeat protein